MLGSKLLSICVLKKNKPVLSDKPEEVLEST